MNVPRVELRYWIAGLTLCLFSQTTLAGEAGSVYVSSSGGASCTAPDVSSEIDIAVSLSYQQWVDGGGQSSRTAQLDTSADELDHTNCRYSLSINEIADDAAVFNVLLEGGEVAIDPSDNTSVTVNINVDLTELEDLPSTNLYEGSYDITLTGFPK